MSNESKETLARCLLCGNPGRTFYKGFDHVYYKCGECGGIFVESGSLPGAQLEIERYRTHNNDVEDPRYQKFVSPIVDAVVRDFLPGKHSGLDFGAGTGPVISKMLREKGYEIAPYDPFFHNKPELLESKYHFIVCCEVMEHFHRPLVEFRSLKKLLHPGGKIYCMTALYSNDIDFATWYYKNDPTHVFIYQKETVHFIQKSVGFSAVRIEGRLIVFNS